MFPFSPFSPGDSRFVFLYASSLQYSYVFQIEHWHSSPSSSNGLVPLGGDVHFGNPRRIAPVAYSGSVQLVCHWLDARTPCNRVPRPQESLTCVLPGFVSLSLGDDFLFNLNNKKKLYNSYRDTSSLFLDNNTLITRVSRSGV